MTTPDNRPEASAGEDRRKRNHPRPARFSKEVRLPLAVRKELLLTRAALERHDAVVALRDARIGARHAISLSSWLGKAARLGKPSGWLGLLGLTKQYPLVSAAVTLSLPLLKRLPVGRVAWKLSKVGLLAGAGYWAYKTWNEASAQAIPPALSPDVGTPSPDGFSDPLVP